MVLNFISWSFDDKVNSKWAGLFWVRKCSSSRLCEAGLGDSSPNEGMSAEARTLGQMLWLGMALVLQVSAVWTEGYVSYTFKKNVFNHFSLHLCYPSLSPQPFFFSTCDPHYLSLVQFPRCKNHQNVVNSVICICYLRDTHLKWLSLNLEQYLWFFDGVQRPTRSAFLSR